MTSFDTSPATLPHASSTPQTRRSAMLGISLAVCIATLDTSIVTTALPTIGNELGASPAAAIWVVTVYQLVMVAAMLPLAALGEVLGHRRVFIGGLVVFTLASLFCGAAPSLPWLIAARVLQGLGAAGIMGTNTALVRLIYPPKQLGRGLGVNALVIAVGLASGPVVASAVLSFTSWHGLFYLNLPIGLLAIPLAWRRLPGQPAARHPFDLVAALLCAAAFGLLIHGLGALSHAGPGAQVALEWLLAALCFAVLVRRERGRATPVLPVDLLRSPPFALSTATAVCAFATQALAFVALPFLFLDTQGRSQAEIGLLIAPWPVMGAIMAPIAGALSDRISAGLLGGIGLACLSAGLMAMALLPADVGAFTAAACMMLCGFGFGLFLSPNQRVLMSSAPPGRGGSASGVLSTARLLGQAVGGALVALCFALSPAHGSVSALWLGGGFAALGCVLSLVRLLPMVRSPAR